MAWSGLTVSVCCGLEAAAVPGDAALDLSSACRQYSVGLGTMHAMGQNTHSDGHLQVAPVSMLARVIPQAMVVNVARVRGANCQGMSCS